MERTVAAPEAISYETARARVLEQTQPLPEESVTLDRARGRASRQRVVAEHELPPFDNSSMDGVAVRSLDLANASESQPVELAVVASIAAGGPHHHEIASSTCAWIMTGAPLPPGTDAVVPIEELALLEGASPERAGGNVRIHTAAKPGSNVRRAGADVRAGEVVLEAGRELSPHDVGLLAALGKSSVAVGRRPRVTILSTGDELLEVHEPLLPGAIRDSNRPMLAALLEESGAVVIVSRHIEDDSGHVAEAIAHSLDDADVTITIGGVSEGAFDPVKQGLVGFEEIALWRVAMKPGRPQAFGAREGRLFFGLPGNPASVACVFEALVRPALRKLQGYSSLDRPRISTRVEGTIESRAGRTDFVRVVLTRRGDEWWAREAGAQISGHLSPQSRAHALLIVPEARERLAHGEEAEALLLRWP